MQEKPEDCLESEIAKTGDLVTVHYTVRAYCVATQAHVMGTVHSRTKSDILPFVCVITGDV